MSTRLFTWEQDGSGGDHGVLTLWPDTHRETTLRVESFRVANALGMSINAVTKEAFKDGRASMLVEIARLKP